MAASAPHQLWPVSCLALPPLLLPLLLLAGQIAVGSACNSSLSVSEINETAVPGQTIQPIDSSYQTTLLGQPDYLCYFQISAGYLRLARSFDLENFTACSDGSTIARASVLTAVTVTVQCVGSADTATFLIRLVDVNEFPPLFSPDQFRVNMSEAAAINTLVIQLNGYVSDRDKSNQLTFNFNMVNGSQGAFGIVDGITSGIVRLQRTLDFDAGARQYVMTVSASELTSEPASQPKALIGFATVVVDVLDFDDQNPAFTQNSYALYFMENNTGYVDTPLATNPPLEARDMDVGINQTINYAIVSTPASGLANVTFLTVNSTTGQFHILSLIDRESLPSNQMLVLVKGYQTDKPDTRVTLALVLITVGDKNDNAPVMSSDFYNSSIAENSPAGSYVNAVSATDRDLGENATFRYQLSDPSGAFQIDPVSGRVTVANSSLLDRETTPAFSLTVWAVESATPERYASPPSLLTVALLDVNDNSPKFGASDGYNVSASRQAAPGTALLTLTAADPDQGANGRVVFSVGFVSSGGGPLFALDSATGVLTTSGALTSAPADQYLLEVVAEDRAEPPTSRHRATTVVVVTLTSAPTTTVSTSASTGTGTSTSASTTTTSSSASATTTSTTTISSTQSATTSATTTAPIPSALPLTPTTPSPTTLIIVCGILALTVAVLCVLLVWCCLERSRLSDLAASQAAAMDALRTRTNPIFAKEGDGQHAGAAADAAGPEAADDPETADARDATEVAGQVGDAAAADAATLPAPRSHANGGGNPDYVYSLYLPAFVTLRTEL